MSVTFSYFTANGYPAADYLEYPLLLAQGGKGSIQEIQSLRTTFEYYASNIKLTLGLNFDPALPQNVALFAMAFYFDSAPAAVMAASAVAYFAPLYLLSQGILGPAVVQLAAVRKTSTNFHYQRPRRAPCRMCHVSHNSHKTKSLY